MPMFQIRPEQRLLVASHFKRQAIRKTRSTNPLKAGDLLKFSTRHDVREKYTVFMVGQVKEVLPIVLGYVKGKVHVEVDGKVLTPEERVSLAEGEGFPGTIEMIDYYRKKFLAPGAVRPWKGTLVRW